MRKGRVACDARALTHSQARFCRTASINEINKQKSQFRVSILALAGSPNIPERKGLPAAPFTSANALVNSLAGFLFFAEILETCSVSGTAYWVFRNLNDRILTFRVTVGIFGCRIRTPRSHLPLDTSFQRAKQFHKTFRSFGDHILTFRDTVGANRC